MDYFRSIIGKRNVELVTTIGTPKDKNHENSGSIVLILIGPNSMHLGVLLVIIFIFINSLRNIDMLMHVKSFAGVYEASYQIMNTQL